MYEHPVMKPKARFSASLEPFWEKLLLFFSKYTIEIGFYFLWLYVAIWRPQGYSHVLACTSRVNNPLPFCLVTVQLLVKTSFSSYNCKVSLRCTHIIPCGTNIIMHTYQYFHALQYSEQWMCGRVEHVCIPQNHCPIPTIKIHIGSYIYVYVIVAKR